MKINAIAFVSLAAFAAVAETVKVADCVRNADLDVWAAADAKFCRAVMSDVFKAAGHFNTPLSGEAYAPVFAPIWISQIARWGISQTEYAKGDLPTDFISVETLCNMMRHAVDLRMQKLFKDNSSSRTFTEFLSDCLREQYPEIFGGKTPLWFGSAKIDEDIPHDIETIRESIVRELEGDSD